MVHAAIRVLREEPGNGRGLAKRLHQFYFAVRLRHKDNPDTMFGKILRCAASRTKVVTPPCSSGSKVGNSDGDVVDPANHDATLGNALKVFGIKTHDVDMGNRPEPEHRTRHPAQRLSGNFLDLPVIAPRGPPHGG